MDGCDGAESVGEIHCRPNHEWATHAVANGANARRVCVGVFVDKPQHRLGVAAGSGCIQRAHQREHLRHRHFGSFFEKIFAGMTVIKVWKNDKVAGRCQAPCHVMQFLAFSRGIHIKKNDGKWASFVGVGHEGVHGTCCGRQLNVLFDHDASPW